MYQRQYIHAILFFNIVIITLSNAYPTTPTYDFSKPPFLYTDGKLHGLMRACMNSPLTSQFVGWFANAKIPFLTTSIINQMIKHYKINLQEAEKSNPHDYKTINDLFTRKLKASSRPLDDLSENTILSPADGLLTYFAIPDQTTPFIIKDTAFNIISFTDNKKTPENIAPFCGGTMLVIYLSPRDYHRFHMPCHGTIESIKYIGGRYESVHPSIKRFATCLQENKRVMITIIPDHNKETRIIYTAVGAMFVGEITINKNIKQGTHLNIGDELGYFSFGGSTVTLIFEKNSFFLEKSYLPDLTNTHLNWTPVQMGKKIGILESIKAKSITQ